MNEPIDVDINAAKTVAIISIPVEGDGTDSTSNAALDGAARRHHPRRRSARCPTAEVAVTGTTA